MPRFILWILVFAFNFHFIDSFATGDPVKRQVITHNNKHFGIEQILSKYLQIPSESGHEQQAGEFLKQLCEENGLHITQMGSSDGNYNFSASLRPLEAGLPNIIFLNHIDVVPPGSESHWEVPPYSGKIIDSEIWGRGAFDNKGTAVMHLFSLIEMAQRYEGKNLDYNVTMLSVSCEETQCDGGISYVIDNYFELLNPEVVIGEGPPGIKGLIDNHPDQALFGISVAQKRSLWLQLSLDIKTNGHSSVTPKSYANKEMITALNELLNEKNEIIYNDVNVGILKQLGILSGGFNGFVLKHPRLFKSVISKKLREDELLLALFSNTITLTSIKDDNDELNAIPTKITATLDCRLLPETSTDEFIADLRETLDNDAISIEVIKQMNTKVVTSSNTNFYKNMAAAIQQHYPESKSGAVMLPNSNDVAAFREKDVLAYSIVPVKIDRKYLETIHTFNERIPVAILEQGKNTYVSFLERCITIQTPRESVELVSRLRANENTLFSIKI